MCTLFYVTPTYVGAIISSSSGSWDQNFFKTYDNEIGREITAPKHVEAM